MTRSRSETVGPIRPCSRATHQRENPTPTTNALAATRTPTIPNPPARATTPMFTVTTCTTTSTCPHRRNASVSGSRSTTTFGGLPGGGSGMGGSSAAHVRRTRHAAPATRRCRANPDIIVVTAADAEDEADDPKGSTREVVSISVARVQQRIDGRRCRDRELDRIGSGDGLEVGDRHKHELAGRCGTSP